MQYANLHLHSTYSDAGFTPEQLVKLGKSLGYGALALTDHETDAGCKEFMRACERMGVRSVTGVEFYGKCGDAKLHLTALDFDPEAPSIRNFIDERVRLQNEHLRKCVDRGLELGLIEGITFDDIVYFHGENAWLCVDSLIHTLNYKKAMPEGGGKFVRMNVIKAPEMKALKPPMPPAEEVIKAVRDAGGVIALAHPSYIGVTCIKQLVDWGMNGIETNHPSIKPEVQPIIELAAERYNLYQCGGTDHTGPMSCCGGDRAIPVFNGITEEQYDILVERRLG